MCSQGDDPSMHTGHATVRFIGVADEHEHVITRDQYLLVEAVLAESDPRYVVGALTHDEIDRYIRQRPLLMTQAEADGRPE